MIPATSLAPEDGFPVVRVDRTGTPFLIRPHESADGAALEAFYLEFEPKRTAQGLPPEGLERIRRWLRPVLATGIHLLAFRGDVLIGHSLLVPAAEPDTLEYAVFLRASERGLGVGTGLNLEAVRAARAASVGRLWLSVAPHNRAAIRSYENAGFRFRSETIYSPEMEMDLVLRP